MTTTLQLAILAGALVGLGIALMVFRLAPVRPDLAAYLKNYSPTTTANAEATKLHGTGDSRDRLGWWLMNQLPLTSLLKVPAKELAILRRPVHRFFAEKFLFGILGMIFPTLMYAVVYVIGVHLPIYIPLGASLLIGIATSFIPDLNIRQDAAEARAEFSHALGAYVDLLALERASGTAQRQAMETAAEVGDSWVFKRISEELRRSRWSGVAPWDSLKALADELELPDLYDVADIMRLSGEDGAAVADTLRARAASMRSALQAKEIATANTVVERMSIPASLLFGVYVLLLIAPVGLRILLGM